MQLIKGPFRTDPLALPAGGRKGCVEIVQSEPGDEGCPRLCQVERMEEAFQVGEERVQRHSQVLNYVSLYFG